MFIANIVFCGLGGQGVLTSSDILADAAFRAGFDVKKAEVHGMSQRGGSVRSDVRFGTDLKRVSPMVPAGRADVIVALADDQLYTVQETLSSGGEIVSQSLIDSSKLANAKSANVALLGVLSGVLKEQIPEACFEEAIRALLPEKLHADNLSAFLHGRQQRTSP